MITTRIAKRVLVAFVDFLILSIALYSAVTVRYWIAIKNIGIVPDDRFLTVFYPFLIIFFINILVFYMYGLYDKMTVKIYKELNQRILSSQILSSILGSIIFYTSSIFSIAPKTILVIYIIISSALIYIWRKYIRVRMRTGSHTRLLIVGEGEELKELREELSYNKILNLEKIETVDLENNKGFDLYTQIKNKVLEGRFNMLAINMHHAHIKNNISLFYDLLLDKVEVVNFADLYEETFDKIPLHNIDAGWFFNNFYGKENKLYPKAKRAIDLILVVPLFLFSLVFYPFVYLFIKIQDGGSVFYTAERVGKDGQVFKIYKFRSMTFKKPEEIDVASKDEASRVTKFGNFMRKTRIDELPQLINVIKGDLSFIGPRPEFPALVKEYSNQIPFYGIRHTVIPGLSGFAQIYQEQKSVPKFGISADATKVKLSYDIYYLKHKSILMDLSLMLKTVKVLLGKTGL